MSRFLFQVFPASGVPIYRQLAEQVRLHAAANRLKSGEFLPSVRQVAQELQINPMTVSKAYSILERDGVVENVRGQGMRLKAPAATARFEKGEPHSSHCWNTWWQRRISSLYRQATYCDCSNPCWRTSIVSNLETTSRPSTAEHSTELLIDVSGLRKQFKRGKEVLCGVDLQIPRGTVLGLLGKNGAGKTTLIKCLLGLLKPTSGAAAILGENAWNLSAEAKERLGYVPQVVALYPWMKVKHLVAYTAAFYPNWNADLAGSLVYRWEIPLDDRVGTLSVGQLQKLSIILSLSHEPDVLILDEPAASLDPVARREFLSEVLNIANQPNRTVLFSTHITSDIERVADTVAILKEGKIVYHGELGELKDSIKRLHFSAADSLPRSFAVPARCRRVSMAAMPWWQRAT